MALKEEINKDIMAAMKAKEKESLDALRAIKSAILLAETEKTGTALDSDSEMKLLQKLVKQRKESADLYVEQGRQDLADVEINQAKIIEKYLPEQMDEAAVEAVIKQIIEQTGASSPSDMGKVMGTAMKQLSGKADGKMISSLAKKLLG